MPSTARQLRRLPVIQPIGRGRYFADVVYMGYKYQFPYTPYILHAKVTRAGPFPPTIATLGASIVRHCCSCGYGCGCGCGCGCLVDQLSTVWYIVVVVVCICSASAVHLRCVCGASAVRLR